MSLVSRFGPGGVTIEADELEALSEPAPVVVEALPDGVSVLPYNATTGKAYAGRNIERLLTAEILGEYGTGGWAGFKQWLSVGRVVRKGEHGTACITVIGGREGASQDAPADGKSKGKGRGVRGFRVFHYDQTTELVEE